MKQKLFATLALVLCLTLTTASLYRSASAQETQDERDIKAEEVLRDRRKDKKPSQTSGRSSRYRVRPPTQPASKFPVGSPPKDKSYITVGVTLWRVRLTTAVESKDSTVSKERMVWDRQEREVVVTRISDERPVTDKDLVQMSIEYLPHREGSSVEPPNRVGYLYVINREQFSDGSLKNARLIFPTLRTYKGDNRVLSGKTVTLPDPKRPFQIGRSASGQVQAYETYTVILSPVPLDSELPQELGPKAMELSPHLVAKWEQQWGAGQVRADLLGGMGQTRTQKELKANGDTDEKRDTKDADEDLTQDDQPPQTVFRTIIQPGAAMLVTIKLPFKEAAPAKQ